MVRVASLPYSLPRCKLNCAKDESSVSRFTSIGSRFGELPVMPDISGCNGKSSTRSQIRRYSRSRGTNRAPFISETHQRPALLSATVCCLITLLGTVLRRLGAKYSVVFSPNHLSVQNILFQSFPTTDFTATLKRARALSKASPRARSN